MNTPKQASNSRQGPLRAWRFLAQAFMMLAWFLGPVQGAGAAQAPGIIGFQGKLAISGVNPVGTCEFKFALVDKAGEKTYWSHDQTSTVGDEPRGSGIWLPVEAGNFTVNLGDVTIPNMVAAVPASVFTNTEVFLRVWVSDGTGAFQQLTPDSRLISAPYALAAETVLARISEAQMPTNTARLDASQTFTGVNTFAAPTRLTNRFNLLVGRHVGDGSALTNIRASSIVGMSLSGTTGSGGSGGSGGDNRQTPVFLEGNQTFTGSNTFTGVVQMTNPTNKLVGSYFGDGGGLSNINVASIVGTLEDITLPPGLMIASMLPRDSRLLSRGFRRVASLRPPAWEHGSESNAPSARYAHTAVWDGQRMIIWGGRVGIGTIAINSGGMYYPESDRWEAVSTINAPAPRWDHTALWTGKEMLVWGGNGPTGQLNSGGNYSPVQQLWKPTSNQAQSGVPSARQGHISVWTGSRMVIWGGHNRSGVLNDGAVYDPDTDTWSALTLPNPPEGRTGAAALWARDRVLIWGGEGMAGHLRSGSQLVFSGNIPDRWVPISLVGAPSQRRGYSAVWTGEKVMVWGGENGGVQLNDGAAYDPFANTWEQISDTNAPAARSSHAATWTGDLMLILGGTTGGTELSTGWAFDLASRLWWQLSMAGSPQVRAESTACWTGTEVLVFGGRANGQAIGKLERLSPEPLWHFYRKL